MKNTKSLIELSKKLTGIVKQIVILAFKFHKAIIIAQIAVGLTSFFMMAIGKIINEKGISTQVTKK